MKCTKIFLHLVDELNLKHNDTCSGHYQYISIKQHHLEKSDRIY